MIPTRFHIRLLIDTLMIAGVSFLLVIFALVLSIVSYFGGNATFPIDCAIVFGAAVHGTDRAGPGITRRVQTAGELYKEGKVSRIFLTGGKGDEHKKSEAQVMKKVALLSGIDPEAITLEEQATSTLQNIKFTKPRASDCASVVAVSDRYHLARIAWLGRQLDWNDLQVHPAESKAPALFEWKATLREAFAFLYTTFVVL